MSILEFDSSSLISSIKQIFCLAAEKHDYWDSCLENLLKHSDNFPFGIHLAIFVEPYLKLILEGKKTVESRFSIRRVAPYQKIYSGDILLMKRSGGPIIGICKVAEVLFYRLNPREWLNIKKDYTESLCIQDSSFWNKKKDASYATLMHISYPVNINPIKFSKRDRRGWVVLCPKINDEKEDN